MSVKLFSGANSTYLAEKISKVYGKKLGAATLQKFSDGEISPEFNESVRGSDIFLIQSTFPPALTWPNCGSGIFIHGVGTRNYSAGCEIDDE